MPHGRQVTAARALAGITIRELAGLAGTTKRIITDLEAKPEITISEKRRHGHTSRDLWDRIIAALRRHGVELVDADSEHGAGVRWVAPGGPGLAERSQVS